MNNVRRSMETLIPLIHTPYRGFHAGPLNTIVGAHVSCPGFGQIMLWGFNSREIVLYRGGPIQKTGSVTHCWVVDTDLA